MALTDTSFNASAKSSVLLATRGENSPRECPAAISGLASSRVEKAAMLCMNTAVA
ncbi:MAG: hypothetical protein U0T56_03590 [Ferruginibacter sp.]